VAGVPKSAGVPDLTGVQGCRVVTWSGSARILLRGQLESLSEIEWSVVSGDPFTGPPTPLRTYHVPMRREPAASDFRSFWLLYRFFRRHRFAFVQTHTPKASMLGLPAARLAGLPTLYTMHGSLYFKDNSPLGNLAGWVFERWCSTWAGRVLLQSAEDAEVVPRARICRAGKVVHVGNGIDVEHFAGHRQPLPDGDPPVVLMISRLVSEKGCLDFFRVARALRSKARFVHVGPVETDQRDAVTDEEIAELSAAGIVEFVGPVADVRPELARATLVLLPSYREGIPRAAMEAAASGRAVVGYNVRGVREVIPPELGLLVGRGDVEALTLLVKGLLDDHDRIAKAADACAEWVTAEFSEAVVCDRLRRVYAEVLGRH
jgi:glycosyltransferase involved in cell wall biosynthesis